MRATQIRVPSSSRLLVVIAAMIVGAGLALAADPPGTIHTVAGGGVGDGGPATAATVDPFGVTRDGAGNLFIADGNNHRVRKVSPDGTIITVAGNGFFSPLSGDAGPATSATLNSPSGITVDGAGSLLIADFNNSRIRKVALDGTITTVAGTFPGFSGDGGPATAARLNAPSGVTLDGAGNLFIADTNNSRIRKVSPGGTISTVAGSALSGFSGDGGPAIAARLNQPRGVAVDGAGNLLIADSNNSRIRKVALDGTITTVAGTFAGFSGDGGPATAARLNAPSGVTLDGAGNLFIADTNNSRIRKVALDGTITTAAGNGIPGFSGDGGPATAASLSGPSGVTLDGAGNLFIADGSLRVRKVALDGTIATVAGNGTRIFGDGGPATAAALHFPTGVAADGIGNFFIADFQNHRIRRVAADGTIATVAGNGIGTFSGDGGPAVSASLRQPWGVSVDGTGSLLIADTQNHRIRKVAMDGTITTVAGNGIGSFSGDGGPATAASLRSPRAVTADSAGNLFIGDSANHRIRKVALDGTITTVAGSGLSGFSGDGGPATAARLNEPRGVAVDGAGNLFIADFFNGRVRKVAPDGTITTVAGGGPNFPGDGGPATAALLSGPGGVTLDDTGNLFIVENSRVRKVTMAGTITTVAGNGIGGFAGDGGPATAASLFFASGIAVDGTGNIFIAEGFNRRIRKVTGAEMSIEISAPASIVQECDDSEEGATVHFVFEVAAGPADYLRVRDVTGARTLLELANPADGQYGVGPVSFPHGGSTVVIELVDGTTVLASETFTVHIEDTIAPVLTGCEPVTIELQGPLTTLYRSLLGITVVDACDPNPTVTFAPAALGLGTTPVTTTARDATGNTSSCTFDVTVVDTTPPVFTVCPSDTERHCEAGGVLVSFDVLAEDLSGAVGIACDDETGRPVDKAGTTFDVGEHTVTCTATDSSGNNATCSFLVTVIDDESPVIVCPEDVTAGNAPGVCFAYVEFTVMATDECDPDVGIVTTAPWGPVQSGDAFPMGTTTVTATARDHSGNEATCMFNITVEDREPPALSGPDSVTLVTDCGGSPVTVTPASLGVTATDNCDVDVAIVAAPSSVGPGTTEVVCTASDDDGNASQKAVQVTVLKGPFECRLLRPLDHNVDNLIQPGQTVPVKLRVSCDNVFEPGVLAVIDTAVQIDGEGTPVGNDLTEDSGASSDNGNMMRLVARDEHYIYNLSTKGWPATKGARFRVTIRITMAGHVDTLCDVILKNK